MALGVMGSDVVRLVLRKAGVLALAGLLLGTALSLASSRLIGSLLFGLTATDTATYLIVFAVVGVIAGLAAAGPAWQASRIDPMVALRED
jgi:ABC-type antimicrobial peptide transport system permease subunit